MKVFFVTAGTARAAATRYRVNQYLPLLKEKGVDYDIFSITSGLMTGYMIKSPEMKAAARLVYYSAFLAERFMRSWVIILKSRRYDSVFLQRVTFPLKLERLLRWLNPNIIFDIDDAIYLPDVQGDDLLTKLKGFIKEEEVKSVLRVSKCVIAENEYIKSYVSRFCSNIYKIPGPIDTDRYFVKEKAEGKDLVLGWIGSPATTPYLNILNSVFTKLSKKRGNITIRLIGAGKYSLPGVKIEKIPWNYDTEIAELQRFDIGLMSMPDDEWTRGKLGCKMLQYMALGIPTVASDTVTNREIMVDGVNGFLAKNEDEWISILTHLIDSPELRRTIGLAGRRTVEEKCSLNKSVDLLIDILSSPSFS